MGGAVNNAASTHPRALRIVPVHRGTIILLGSEGSFAQVWPGHPVASDDTLWMTQCDHEALRRAPLIDGVAG